MKIKDILVITLIIFIVITSLTMFPNKANAATYIIDKTELYSKGEIVCFTYKNILVGVEFVVYKKDGVEYPAYCLNRDLPGITEEEEYTVKVDKLVSDNKIWRAVTNGYPYKSAKELGCSSDIEAFAATKMAVYDMMYNYNWNDFKGRNEQGTRIVNTAKKISDIARKSTSTKPVSIVNIITDDTKWEMDELNKEYASKEFWVKTNVDSTKYTVSLKNIKIDNVKITDINNNEKTEFKVGEKFKVLIPITEMTSDGNFAIEVTADMKTKPILYGDSGNSKKQSYALAGGDYEFENTALKLNYLANNTKIEIIKKDAETGKKLVGAKFNLLDENQNIVYSDITTNKDGIATIENIRPGKYYVKEIKSPDGYTIYDELIEIDVKLNQKYTVNVNNYEEPENEEKEVEDGDTTVTGRKEVNLPRTGF